LIDPIIETERIILRPFISEDAAAVYDFNSNEAVIRYTGDVLFTCIEEAQAAITRIRENDYKKYGYGRLAVFHKKDQRVIGFAGLKCLAEIGETDIGYRILPEYWNKGITSELIFPILKFGFETLELRKITGYVMPENSVSSHLLEKHGFQFQKQDSYPGETIEVKWYSMSIEEYRLLNW